MEINAVKTLVATLILSFFCFGPCASHAEIKSYESTDNTGQNKKERIDSVESYLTNLSNSLQKMETKLDENAKKIQALDQTMKSVQDKMAKKEAEEKLASVAKASAKKGEEKGGEKSAEASSEKEEEKMDAKVGERTAKSEIDKLKADMMALKNQDMEKLKASLEELSDTVKAIQATLKKD